jgi:hypothetical protein
MTFFIKNTGGPGDGFFPNSDEPIRCVNRSGSAIAKGDVVMLDMAASAAEITTNDSNSYLPGAGDASGDSVWATVINVTDAVVQNGGSFLGVCLDNSVADNAAGNFQFYGIVASAFVTSASTTGCVGGSPLTAVASATGSFDGIVQTNERVVAFYLDAQDITLTTRALKRVFLHNGALGGSAGTLTT